MTAFPDHFSGVAAQYARYRPHYPAALFDWIADIAPARSLAWDCACGSGQATMPLVERFRRVIATDASADQVQHAPVHPRIDWRVAPAEASGLADGSVDAIIVAQALHWFDPLRFWHEARRAGRSGAVLACWSYGLASTDEPDLTTRLHHLHDDIVGPYWPIERGHVDVRYETIDFPFDRIAAPPVELTAQWTLDQLLGYLRTWSAVRRYIAANGHDPIDAFGDDIALAWGAGTHAVRWPMTILAGRI